MDMPILCNIRAEDIEDVSERYIPMFTEERNSDTVKRIKITEKDTFYFISLIEHKTKSRLQCKYAATPIYGLYMGRL